MTDHTPLTDLLAEVHRLDGEATEGPWEFEPDRTTRDGVYPAYVFAEHMAGYPICDATSTHIPAGDEDAEFIALSRTALPALAAAVEAVMEVHRPDQPGDIEVFCVECKVSTPCPTIRALNEAMGGGDDE